MGQYTCDRCKRGKKPIKPFYAGNDMNPDAVPVQMQGLSQAEEILNAKGCPVMRV